MEAGANLDRNVAFAELRSLTSLSRTTLWRLVKADKFPKPHKLNCRRVAWRESEVREWLGGKTDWATSEEASNA